MFLFHLFIFFNITLFTVRNNDNDWYRLWDGPVIFHWKLRHIFSFTGKNDPVWPMIRSPLLINFILIIMLNNNNKKKFHLHKSVFVSRNPNVPPKTQLNHCDKSETNYITLSCYAKSRSVGLHWKMFRNKISISNQANQKLWK